MSKKETPGTLSSHVSQSHESLQGWGVTVRFPWKRYREEDEWNDSGQHSWQLCLVPHLKAKNADSYCQMISRGHRHFGCNSESCRQRSVQTTGVLKGPTTSLLWRLWSTCPQKTYLGWMSWAAKCSTAQNNRLQNSQSAFPFRWSKQRQKTHLEYFYKSAREKIDD